MELQISADESQATMEREDLGDILRLIVLDRTGGVPLHVQLRNSLRRIILESLQDGDRLPAEELISMSLAVSRATVRRALNDLTLDGLIERRRALGTVVTKAPVRSGLSEVAVIMPDFDSYTLSMDSTLLGAIDRHRRELGADLRMLRFKKGEEWTSFEKLIPFSPLEGGVILLGNPPQATGDMTNILTDRGYRTVNVDAYYTGYNGAYVGMCNKSAVEMGLDYLFELGHRDIAFLVGEPEEVFSVRERCDYFEAHARKLGLKNARVFHCGTHYWENSSAGAANAMPNLWKGKHKPTAIFAISDYSALGALNWLQREGVRVPEDVSLLSFDGTQLCRMVMPNFTTLIQPVDEIAREIFRILESNVSKPTKVLVKPKLREAESARGLEK